MDFHYPLLYFRVQQAAGKLNDQLTKEQLKNKRPMMDKKTKSFSLYMSSWFYLFSLVDVVMYLASPRMKVKDEEISLC